MKGLVLAPLLWGAAPAIAPSEAKEVEVGSYLPPSPSDPSFVLFKASPRDTPALRAGSKLLPMRICMPFLVVAESTFVWFERFEFEISCVWN